MSKISAPPEQLVLDLGEGTPGGVHLHRSNRLEALADALAEVTAAPLRSVLAPETVVVQSLGMRRWLQQELARRAGVAMQVEFPFPGAFVETVLRAVAPEPAASGAFSREVLPWRVLALFPKLLTKPGFEDLLAYTSGEPRALKQFQLAERIAATFDRYLAYRPQMLLEWEARRDRGWQAQLWRELVRGHEGDHPPALSRKLAEKLRRRAVDAAQLPERVSVFGISSLPPVYIELLAALAGIIEVHLFLLEPTADYWADLVSPRERDREARRRKLRALPEDEEPELSGNALLASLCKTGRDFAWLLLDRIDAHSDDDRFEPPSEPTLLGKLQADIFFLREPAERRAIASDDRSLQVHCCHGPMRELEVLHDQLLALFEATPGLAPREILVTMPDVETYAPFIEAVFGAPESDAVRIPYTIADRAARAESSVADTFLRVLDLAGSRYPAPAVAGLLETPAVRERFELHEADLPAIRGWITRTGIRWGLDAGHRAEFDLPPFAQNSWRAGLDRLLLGYALPGDGGTLFAGVLPEPEIEGALAIVLGRFVEFTERLFRHTAALATPRTPAAWEKTLRDLLDDLFAASDHFADEVRRVSAALEDLRDHTRTAEFDAPVEFAAIRAWLAGALADTESGPGFLSGRVTFCALKPMRSIPFRVLCMFGLDDAAFPRRNRPPTFDLTAQRPRRGDRTVRDDDRYLFLEALLSARETLYLSYAGLSVQDNAESPPSVLVSELLDYLARHYALPPDFVLKHRLQPFSAAYFSGENPRFFSYSADNAAAARRGAAARAATAPFAAQPLPEPGPEWREVTLDQLIEFITKPARYFLRHRLRLRLPHEEEPLADSEPVTLEGLEKHRLREALAHRLLAHREAAGPTGAASESSAPVTTPLSQGVDEPDRSLDAPAERRGYSAAPTPASPPACNETNQKEKAVTSRAECRERSDRNAVEEPLRFTPDAQPSTTPKPGDPSTALRSARDDTLVFNPATSVDAAAQCEADSQSAQASAARRLAAARASGALPIGYAGDSTYGAVAREVDDLLARLAPALAEPLLPPLTFALDANGWRLSGTLADVRPAGLVRYRAAKCKPPDHLRAWVAHLALQIAAPPEHPRTTTFHSTDQTLQLRPVPDAAAHLTALLRLYARGLSAPLPFYPESSLKFARRHEGLDGGNSEPIHAARGVWEGNQFGKPAERKPGEVEDGWNALATRGIEDPLDAEFERLALAVWRPVFVALGEIP